MSYSVKEIFYTLQGEGANAGRAAVFCRFAGCNLWSGREEDRETAVCRFCDTDFVGTDGTLGGKYASAQALAAVVASEWPADPDAPVVAALAAPRAVDVLHVEPGVGARRLVVLTGGEPLLQVDEALVAALHAEGFEIAVETNGTVPPPPGLDWLCVSPKAGSRLVVHKGQELKVVIPQEGLDLQALAQLPFEHHFVQAMDGPLARRNTELATAFCMANPRWRLSVQTHKVIGIR
jgi:7-carboxy-7-deazaguanine synthase (Cx14CxxC type)